MSGSSWATYVVGGKYTRDTKLRVLEYYFRNGGDRFGNKQETANRFNIDSKTVFRFLQLPEIVQLARRRARNRKCATASSASRSEVRSPAPSAVTSSSSASSNATRADKQSRPSAPAADSLRRPTTTTCSNLDPASELDQLNLSAIDAESAQLSQSAIENFSNLAQLVRVFDVATDELRNILLYECQLIYECRVCSALFRNLAQIITHKRRYCLQRHVDTRQLSPTGAMAPPVSRTNGPTRHEPPADKTSRNVAGGAVNLQPRVILEPVDGNSAAVFQTRARSPRVRPLESATGADNESIVRENGGDETMAERVAELRRWREAMADGSTVCLGADGKIVDPANVPVIGEEEVAASLNPLLAADRHVCRHCNTEFSSRKTLSHHVRSMHAGSRVYFPCGCCSGTFTSMFSLERHLQRVHKKKYAELRRLKEQARTRSFLRNIDEADPASAVSTSACATDTPAADEGAATAEMGADTGNTGSTEQHLGGSSVNTRSLTRSTANSSSKKVCTLSSPSSVPADKSAVYCHLCLTSFPSLHLLLCHQLVAHSSGQRAAQTPHRSRIIQRCDYSVARSRMEATSGLMKMTPVDGAIVDDNIERHSRLPVAFLVDLEALRCRICGRQCGNSDALMRHASTHLASGAVTVAVCPLCRGERSRSMTSDRLIPHLIGEHGCSRMDASQIARRVCTVQAVDTLDLAETSELTFDWSITSSPVPPSPTLPLQKKQKCEDISSVSLSEVGDRHRKCKRLDYIVQQHALKIETDSESKTGRSCAKRRVTVLASNTKEVHEATDSPTSSQGQLEATRQSPHLSPHTSPSGDDLCGADSSVASSRIDEVDDNIEHFISCDNGADAELFSGDFNNNNNSSDGTSTDQSEFSLHSGQHMFIQRSDSDEKCSLAGKSVSRGGSSDDVKLTINIGSLLGTVARSGGEAITTEILDTKEDVSSLERSETRSSVNSEDILPDNQTVFSKKAQQVTTIGDRNIAAYVEDRRESPEFVSQDSAVGSLLSKVDNQPDDYDSDQVLYSSQDSFPASPISLDRGANSVSPTKRSLTLPSSPIKRFNRNISQISGRSGAVYRQKEDFHMSRSLVVCLSRLTDEEVQKTIGSPRKIVQPDKAAKNLEEKQTLNMTTDISDSSSCVPSEPAIDEHIDDNPSSENQPASSYSAENSGKILPKLPDQAMDSETTEIKQESINSPIVPSCTVDVLLGTPSTPSTPSLSMSSVSTPSTSSPSQRSRSRRLAES